MLSSLKTLGLKWKQFSEFENTKTKNILFIENPSFLIFNDWKLWKYFGVKLHNFGTVASDQAFTHDDMLNQTIFMPDWKQNSYILCNCIGVSMTTIAQPTALSYRIQVKFCHHSGQRLWRTGMLFSTKSKGHKSNFRISWMYRSHFYDLKVHIFCAYRV